MMPNLFRNVTFSCLTLSLFGNVLSHSFTNCNEHVFVALSCTFCASDVTAVIANIIIDKTIFLISAAKVQIIPETCVIQISGIITIFMENVFLEINNLIEPCYVMLYPFHTPWRGHGALLCRLCRLLLLQILGRQGEPWGNRQSSLQVPL